MEPHLNFALALMQDNDPAPELEAIRQLPLEKRYIWRLVSALKWAFADFDNLGVNADRQTLSPEAFQTGNTDDGRRVIHPLRGGSCQWCLS
jgi:hypothetical protein